MKKKAFTLAEVLITLSILGVIAGISIPNIVQQYQKRLNITKLQKAYASIEKMATNIAVSTGCIDRDLSCTGLLDITDSREFSNEFIKLSGINGTTYWKGYYRFFALNADKTGVYEHVNNMVITKDNIGYYILLFNNFWSNEDESNHKAIVINVYTEPNFYTKTLPKYDSLYPTSKTTIIGRNVFRFVIYDNFKVDACNIGWGGRNYAASKQGANGSFCSPDSSINDWHTRGYGCTLKIIQDGWKMNY